MAMLVITRVFFCVVPFASWKSPGKLRKSSYGPSLLFAGWAHHSPTKRLKQMVVIIQIIMLIYGLYHGIYGFISGWWLTYPSEKYELVKVSWDYSIPNWMESHKIDVPNHQPDIKIHNNHIKQIIHLIDRHLRGFEEEVHATLGCSRGSLRSQVMSDLDDKNCDSWEKHIL